MANDDSNVHGVIEPDLLMVEGELVYSDNRLFFLQYATARRWEVGGTGMQWGAANIWLIKWCSRGGLAMRLGAMSVGAI